ncbi:MAG: tetratricopeptide repeat protein [Bacteroidetes bacterium]|nr:tetratricopeptide repeat protein [Bacteroidota bacterium]
MEYVKKKNSCFLLVLFSFSFSHSQYRGYDSLLRIINNHLEDDTVKLEMLARITDNCPSNEAAMQHANNGLALSQKLHHKKFSIRFTHIIGNVFYNMGNYAKSLEYYLKEEKLIEPGDKRRLTSVYNGLGNVYSAMQNYDKAIEYYREGIVVLDSMGSKYIRNHSSFYNNLGLAYFSKKNYNEAVNYFLKVIKLEDGPYATGDAYSNTGDVYFERKSFGTAIEYYKKALSLFEQMGMSQRVSSAYNNIGKVCLAQNNFTEAEQYFTQAIEKIKGTANEVLLVSYDGLSKTNAGLNNYKDAYEYHKKYSDLKDTILNAESSKQIAEMQTKYETEKKEQQINLLNKDKELQDAQLNRQKIIIWTVAGGFLIVLVLSVFIFRERKKSEKLLLNILPFETARELKAKGKASPRYYENVTVMFTDFKGFTTIAEKLSAEELVSELDFLFKKFDEIISKYNIEKIKTIGDSYMCVSGLPTPNSNHAGEIVKAGLEIQNWMIGQNGKWSLRIGIHSGAVTAGVVGDKKFAYDIWGDTVNTASRMESSGEAGKINISGATYQILQGFENLEGLVFAHRGKIPAKNKGEIEMYFIDRV